MYTKDFTINNQRMRIDVVGERIGLKGHEHHRDNCCGLRYYHAEALFRGMSGNIDGEAVDMVIKKQMATAYAVAICFLMTCPALRRYTRWTIMTLTRFLFPFQGGYPFFPQRSFSSAACHRSTELRLQRLEIHQPIRCRSRA